MFPIGIKAMMDDVVSEVDDLMKFALAQLPAKYHPLTKNYGQMAIVVSNVIAMSDMVRTRQQLRDFLATVHNVCYTAAETMKSTELVLVSLPCHITKDILAALRNFYRACRTTVRSSAIYVCTTFDHAYPDWLILGQ